MRIPLVLLVSIFTAGCGAASLDEPAVTHAPAGVSQEEEPRGLGTMSSPPSETSPYAQRTDPSGILVLQTTKLDRFAEVVGVVDVHEAMGSDQAALEGLREKAAAMGADAVVGVEFHHGEGGGEPTHLSGMAVRFVPESSLPSQ